MAVQRVVSLLPSATEIVCALGCVDRLKGRSHECDFPPGVQALPVCTLTKLPAEASSGEIDRQVKYFSEDGASSLYEVDAAMLKSLRPDVILTQGQCEVCAVSVAEVEKAAASLPPDRRPTIVSLSPSRLADLWKDIETVAAALGVPEHGRELLSTLKPRVVDVIQKTCLLKRRPTVACVEWIEPLMAAGNWVPELVEFAGGRNLFGQAGLHSPWMDWTELAKGDPDIVVIMPCGFDLARTRREMTILDQRPEWKALRAVKTKTVFLTDGSHYFNRPGPRLVDSLEILAEIIHPKLFSFGHQGGAWERDNPRSRVATAE